MSVSEFRMQVTKPKIVTSEEIVRRRSAARQKAATEAIKQQENAQRKQQQRETDAKNKAMGWAAGKSFRNLLGACRAHISCDAVSNLGLGRDTARDMASCHTVRLSAQSIRYHQ